MANEEMTVIDGMVVSMDYSLRLDDDEEVVDTSEGREPLEFVQGGGQIIPGLEQEIYGMGVGEEKSVVVQPANGYGETDAEAYQLMPLDAFPSDMTVEPGMGLELRDVSGQVLQAYVADVTTPETRAKGMGAIGAAFGLGFVLGPAVGGLFSSNAAIGLARILLPTLTPDNVFAGMQLLGFVAAAFSLIDLLFALFMLPEPPKRSQAGTERYDLSPNFVKETVKNKRLQNSILIFFISTSFRSPATNRPLIRSASPACSIYLSDSVMAARMCSALPLLHH